MWVNPQFYADMFTFTKEILNEKVHFFVNWFVQVNRQKTTLKKKITYFLKNYVASLFTFFEKVFAICKFFTARCLDVRFWDLLCFICLKFSPQYWYLFLRREKHCVKRICIRSYSGPYFPAFGLNTERNGVSLRIQSECEKIRTRITPNMDTFYGVKMCLFSSYF